MLPNGIIFHLNCFKNQDVSRLLIHVCNHHVLFTYVIFVVILIFFETEKTKVYSLIKALGRFSSSLSLLLLS